MSSQALDLDDIFVRLERASAENGVAASHETVFFVQRRNKHENIESGGLEIFFRLPIRMVAVVATNRLDVVRAAGVVVVNRSDLAHELAAIEQRGDELGVNLETRSIGEVQTILPTLRLRHLLGDLGKIRQPDLHPAEHLVPLRFRSAVDAELKARLAVIDLILDLAPLEDSLLKPLELPRGRSGENGMDDLDSQSGICRNLPLIGVEPASELENGFVEDRVAHSRVVQVQPLRVFHLREQADGVVELRLQILEGHVTVPFDVRHIAECASHRATVLRADCDDPFLRERHAIGIRHAFDVFVIAEKIGLDVVGLTVVTDRKGL